MASRYYTEIESRKVSGDSKYKSPADGSSNRSVSVKTASWPKLPGKGGPDRSGGSPKSGSMGDFYVFSQFSPPKLGTGERFSNLKAKLATEPGVRDPAALAASIGRKKQGANKMAALAAKGKPGF